MAATEALKLWGRRIRDALGLWALLPPSVIGVLGAYLSTSIGWVSALGPFGWFASGLLSFLIASVAFGVIARSRLWRVEARSRARILGDGSPFDPMARVYEGKRLYLRDLAPLGRREVLNKAFVNCEIIGPGTAVLGLRSRETDPFPVFKDCLTFDVDCIEIDSAVPSHLAVTFPGCDFSDCKFYHMTLLFLERSNDSLHWITKDARQALLPRQELVPDGQ